MASSPTALDLEINGPDGLRVVERIVGPVVSIGRADSNSIVLKHDDVSRKHAVIEFVAGRPTIAKPVEAPAAPDLSDNERDRLKRWLRGLLLEALDLPSLRADEVQDKGLAPRVLQLIDELLDEHARELPKGLDRPRLRKELADEVRGLGPLEDLLSDEKVIEVMVIDRTTIYIDRGGRLQLTGPR